MTSNPTECCGIYTTCCGGPLKERLSLTLQLGDNQSTQVIAYDAADPSIHIWKGHASVPSQTIPSEPAAGEIPVSIVCEQGDWFLQVNDSKRVEAKFVECDPLLLEFHDAELIGPTIQKQSRCSIYITD
jgi:hypothetical protein